MARRSADPHDRLNQLLAWLALALFLGVIGGSIYLDRAIPFPG